MPDPDDEWIHPYININERQTIDESPNHYRFLKCFDFVKDKSFQKTGVRICAVTEVIGSEIKNRIVFTRSGFEALVTCVKTTVTNQGADSEFLLKPEEHYLAMRSFVAYLVETGIKECFIRSHEVEDRTDREPLGFNYLMRKQILRALSAIARSETEEFIEELEKFYHENDKGFDMALFYQYDLPYNLSDYFDENVEFEEEDLSYSKYVYYMGKYDYL